MDHKTAPSSKSYSKTSMSVQHGSDPCSSSGAGQHRYGSGASSGESPMDRWYNEQPHDSPYNAIANVDGGYGAQHGHQSKGHKSHKGHKKSGK